MSLVRETILNILNNSTPNQMRVREPYVVPNDQFVALVSEIRQIRDQLNQPVWRAGMGIMLGGRPVVSESMGANADCSILALEDGKDAGQSVNRAPR